MSLHEDTPLEERHATHNWEFADVAAMLAFTAVDADDIGKDALLLDTFATYKLTSVTPITWSLNSNPTANVSGPASSVFNEVARFKDTTGEVLDSATSPVLIDDSGNIATSGTVDGVDVSALAGVTASHISDIANPHNVTPAQVGNTFAQWNANQLQGHSIDPATPAINEVPTWDGGKYIPALPPGFGGGEANTSPNGSLGGGGVDINLTKVGMTLPKKGIAAGSNKVAIGDDAVNKNVTVDVNEGNIVHQNISGKGTNTHAAIDTHIARVAAIYADTSEPTGIVDRADSQISFVDGSRTFTIQPAIASFDFYIKGTKYTKSAPENSVIPDSEGLHFIYYDASGVIQNTQTWGNAIILAYAFVASIYWDATNNVSIYFGDERHGATMDGETHLHFHSSFGARWLSGLAPGDMTVDGSGASNASAQLSISNGAIRDEDILHIIEDDTPQDLSTIAQIPVFYKLGAAGDWRKKPADDYPVIYNGAPTGYSGALVAWNEFTGGAWQLTSATNNDFVLCHIFATNDVGEPVIALCGQGEYGTLGQARAAAEVEINNIVIVGLPFVEFTPIATVIYQTSSGYSNGPKAVVRSTDTGDDYVDWRGQGFTVSGGLPGSTFTVKEATVHADPSGNFDNYRVRTVGATGSHRFNFVVPKDAVEILGIDLIGIVEPGAALSGRDIDLTSSYGNVLNGELYNQHTESDTTTTYDLSAFSNKFYALNLLTVISDPQPGDAGGVFVDHKSIGGDINYLWTVTRYR